MPEIGGVTRGWFVGGLGLVLLAGCAQIPDSGTPAGAGPSQVIQSPNVEAQVRVFAEGPHPGDSIDSIVAGFLEASGAVEDGLRTAREYLTPAAAARWNPGSAVNVYDYTHPRLLAKSADRLQFTAPKDGYVDDQGVFLAAPAGQSVSADFKLTKVNGNWRISALPDGVYVSRQDFEREYASVNLRFLGALVGAPVLVPDPVRLRRDAQLPTSVVADLLRGPSRWLAAAVTTAIPAGAALEGPVDVTAGSATVHLTPASIPDAAPARDAMLAELVSTLTDLEIPAISSVVVMAGGQPVGLSGHGTGAISRADVANYRPVDLRSPAPAAYLIRDGVSYLAGAPATQGPLPAAELLAELAVAPGGARLAGIAKDRKTLWTAAGEAPATLRPTLSGTALHSLSFDQFGDLWVIDGAPGAQVLRRLEPNGVVSTVLLDGFEAAAVKRLRVSADGTRLAMVLDTADGPQVYLALVTVVGDAVRVGSLRRLGFDLVDPIDVGWAAPDQLVVLAAEQTDAPEPFAVGLSGTATDLGPSPLARVDSIAAAPGQPLIATADKVVYRLTPNGGWTELGAGTFATYPG